MTKPDHLREYLCREGFRLELENAVISGKFVYTVFSAVYDGIPRELACWSDISGGYWMGILPIPTAISCASAAICWDGSPGLTGSAAVTRSAAPNMKPWYGCWK